MEAAPRLCRPFNFKKIPPANKSEWRGGKARGRDARYSARGAGFSIGTQSGRTWWVQATTQSERAKWVRASCRIRSKIAETIFEPERCKLLQCVRNRTAGRRARREPEGFERTNARGDSRQAPASSTPPQPQLAGPF